MFWEGFFVETLIFPVSLFYVVGDIMVIQNSTRHFIRYLSTIGVRERRGLCGKTVLLRCDLNVPLAKGEIIDDRKIRESVATIKLLLSLGCRVVVITHLGEPKGIEKSLSTKILVKSLSTLLKRKVGFLSIVGLNRESMNLFDVMLLENIRFDSREVAGDAGFAREMASCGDVYVNDAFAVSHRAHASVSVLPMLLPSYGGLLLEKEVTALSRGLVKQGGTGGKSVWVIGGAKLSKIGIILSALKHADHVLLGGALCLPLINPWGVDVETMQHVTRLRATRGFSKVVLPVDFNCLDRKTGEVRVVEAGKVDESVFAYDIGPKTVELFSSYVGGAKIVVWNGPLGYFEKKPFHRGTKKVLGSISSGCVAVCGGGETSEAVKILGLRKKFTHVSTGGGASLAFLSGEKMPGLDGLVKKI